LEDGVGKKGIEKSEGLRKMSNLQTFTICYIGTNNAHQTRLQRGGTFFSSSTSFKLRCKLFTEYRIIISLAAVTCFCLLVFLIPKHKQMASFTQ